jgi:hypothetical protein
MGTVTATYVGTGVMDNQRYVDIDFVHTTATTYATNGDTIKDFGAASTTIPLSRVTKAFVHTTSGHNDAGVSYELGGTITAPKLKAYDTTGSEVTNATNLTGNAPTRIRLVGA